MRTKSLMILFINFFLFLIISFGSGPACSGHDETVADPKDPKCAGDYAKLRENAEWEMLFENKEATIEIWTNKEALKVGIISPSKELMEHDKAIEYCKNLKIEGWDKPARLPSEAELKAIDDQFGIEQLPNFQWTVCTDHSYKSSVFWVTEKALTIDAIIFSPMAIPYPSIAGKALNVYDTNDIDPTTYIEPHRASADGKGRALCVTDL